MNRMLRGAFLLTILALLSRPASADVGAWSPLGPDAGPAFTLAVDPDDPSTVYAGSEAGVYRSVDAGATWQLASSGLFLQPAAISQDTVAPGALYTVTETGVFRSSDKAQSWVRVEGKLPEPVHDVAADPKVPNRLWAATSPGRLHFSTNGGKSWTKRAATGIADLSISPAGDWLYANTANQGLLRSSDVGASWRPVQGIPKTAYVYDLAFDPGPPASIYAATLDGLYRSRDQGATWQRIAAAVFSGSVPQVEVQGGRIFAAASSGVFYSSDGGSTWTIGGGPLRSRGEVVALAASADAVFAGTWQSYELGGVYRSLDRGATWQLSQQGFTAVTVNAFAVAPSDPDLLYAVAGWTDVFQSVDRGATWKLLSLGTLPASYIHLTDVLVDPADPSNSYLTDLATSRLLRSVDGGATYSTVQIFSAPARLAFDPRSPGALWGIGSAGLHHSADRGNTWQKAGPKVTQPLVFNDVEVDPRNPRVLWIAGTGRLAKKKVQPRVFRSADGGLTWERRDTGIGGKAVLGLALDPAAPDTTLYAATDKGLYRSTDAGKTWKLLTGTAGEITQVATAPTTPATVYAFLTGFGLMRSADRGQTWTPARTGLGALPVLDLAVDPHDPEHLYAGTLGRGLFEFAEP